MRRFFFGRALPNAEFYSPSISLPFLRHRSSDFAARKTRTEREYSTVFSKTHLFKKVLICYSIKIHRRFLHTFWYSGTDYLNAKTCSIVQLLFNQKLKTNRFSLSQVTRARDAALHPDAKFIHAYTHAIFFFLSSLHVYIFEERE